MDVQKRKILEKYLSDEKQELLKQIESLEKGLDLTLSYSTGELSMYDNHPADMGDELFERSKDTALLDNAKLLLAQVETALEKIENGNYGVCSKCGKTIPIERLETIPWAEACIECQREDEASDSNDRPLEESVLTPPFHRSFLDASEGKDVIGFDGEDALQAVMRYGSSDTPQDIPGSRDYKKLFDNSKEEQGIVDPADAIPEKEGRV